MGSRVGSHPPQAPAAGSFSASPERARSRAAVRGSAIARAAVRMIEAGPIFSESTMSRPRLPTVGVPEPAAARRTGSIDLKLTGRIHAMATTSAPARVATGAQGEKGDRRMRSLIH